MFLSKPKIMVSGNRHGAESCSTTVLKSLTLFQYARSSWFGHVIMWSMLSSRSPQCSLHEWFLPGCLLRASVARCRRRRQDFSSVGSESGVPSERHTVRHVLSSMILHRRCAPVFCDVFQFASQLGLTPFVMRCVKKSVISWMVSSLSRLGSSLGFLASSPTCRRRYAVCCAVRYAVREQAEPCALLRM